LKSQMADLKFAICNLKFLASRGPSGPLPPLRKAHVLRPAATSNRGIRDERNEKARRKCIGPFLFRPR
jgi:hypothetical protein